MNYDTTRDELESLFSEAGQVLEIFLPNDRSTGRPRGFAFVEFIDEANALEAIQKFDGYQLQGRNISVREAEERQRPYSTSNHSESRSSYTPKGQKGGSKPKGSRRNARRNARDRKGAF